MKANIWDGSLNIRQKDMVQNEFIGQFIQQKSFNTFKFISKENIFIYCLQFSLDSISNTWILSCTHNSLVAELIWVQASQFRQFREKKYLNEPKKNCPTGAVSRFSSVGALVYSGYTLLHIVLLQIQNFTSMFCFDNSSISCSDCTLSNPRRNDKNILPV